MASTFFPMRTGEPAVVIEVADPGTGRILVEFGQTPCRSYGLTAAQAYRVARALIVAAGVAEHGDEYDADPNED